MPDEPERGLVRATDAAYQGFTLFTPLRSQDVFLVDMQGRVVHRWETDSTPGNSVYLMDDGRLLRAERVDNRFMRGGGQGGRIREYTWDGEISWELDWSDEEKMHHHDFEPLPNGNLLLISWTWKSAEQALERGRDPDQVGEEGFWPDAVFEIEPQRPRGGRVVWEWHAWDHMIQDQDPRRAGFGDVTAAPERIDINADHRREPPISEAERLRRAELDRELAALGYTGDDEEEEEDERDGDRRMRGGDWLHTNGIDYNAEYDLIVLSGRSLSEVWIIDHSTSSEEARGSTGGRWGRGGDLLYRWGNPRKYGQGEGRDRRLYVQHDATFVERADGGLHLLVFNNGEGRPGGNHSSVDEIALPFDPEQGFQLDGGRFGPEEAHWSYSAPEPADFFSSFISGAQRLPNGSTLICEGAKGRMFEVDGAGEIVWEYLNPFGGEEQPRGRGGGRRDGPPRDGPPRDGPPRDRPGGPPGGRPGPPDELLPGGATGRGRGGMQAGGLFRATRIAWDHPALSGRDLSPQEAELAPTESDADADTDD